MVYLEYARHLILINFTIKSNYKAWLSRSSETKCRIQQKKMWVILKDKDQVMGESVKL